MAPTPTPAGTELVHVLDHLTLPADAAEAWLWRWRTEYLPAASARGLKLAGHWRSYAGPDTVSFDMLWEIPGRYAFYGSRGAAAADPAVAQFWADTDTIATARERRVLQPLEEKL